MLVETAIGRLDVQVGFCSECGHRARNEDYGGVYFGTTEHQLRFGVVAAIADGVGGAAGGRVAAELAVRSFIDGYLGQSELQGVQRSGAGSLEAINRWIYALGRSDPALSNMACTFTGLILRGRHAHVIHLGDSRLYRLRDNHLTLLTGDHALSGAGRSHILTRALGSALATPIDYAIEEARVHDRFLLSSDGVHGVLSDRRVEAELALRTAPEDAAQRLVQAALAAGSGDNVTALVVDVLGLPAANMTDLVLAAAAWPILPPPKSGAIVDGYSLGAVVADSRYTRVFRALDQVEQRDVIIKFPKPIVGEDAVLRQAFLRETWIASRVRSPFITETLEVSPERRTRLYTVLPLYDGETLEQRLTRNPPLRLTEGLGIAIRLTKAVAALHRGGIIHRDIKPDNVILQSGNRLKLIDLGVARLPFMEDAPIVAAPGTASYMAPELLTGAAGDARSDLFALGVTIYRMFARAYPYGEVESFSHPRFGRLVPLTTRRPDLPAWLDRVLAQAFAVRPEDRFEDALELLFQLEHAVDAALPIVAVRQPLYERNPLRFWQLVSALLTILLALALGLLRRHG